MVVVDLKTKEEKKRLIGEREENMYEVPIVIE